MTEAQLKNIIEAALFIANKPLDLDQLLGLFAEDAELPSRASIRNCLQELSLEANNRGVELVKVASGYRFQAKTELTPWIKQLYPKRQPRQSRALMETVAIIAYRQPITRSEIESIRGVSVSTQIMKTLLDYQWVRVLAHKESPGRPALYGTTKYFLDHFGLQHLSELPSLNELKDMPDSEELFDPEPENEELSELVEIETAGSIIKTA
jgi:segregation and condensation protein B